MLSTERVLLSTVVGVILMATVAGVSGCRINLSPSVGGLIFWIDGRVALAVGDYVSFCLPMRLASVPAMAKATVPVCMKDQEGAALLKRVSRIDADGNLFVLGEHPKSLDSRVFGWISAKAVQHRLVRVW